MYPKKSKISKMAKMAKMKNCVNYLTVAIQFLYFHYKTGILFKFKIKHLLP